MGNLGKLLRKKNYGSTLLPQAVMSFWAMLAGCFATTRTSSSRPIAKVKLNNNISPALFDTGSTYTLVHSKLKPLILKPNTPVCSNQQVKLCTANGEILKTHGSYNIEIKFANRSFSHPVIFIDKLQVDCIIGMDFMSAANITINARTEKSIWEKKPFPQC